MSEPVTAMPSPEPANEREKGKDADVFHDASDRPLSSATDDSTAAPTYEEPSGPSGDKKAPSPIVIKPAVIDEPTVMSPMALASPDASEDVLSERHQRAATAESNLSAQTKQKLSSAEIKQAKQMSKMLTKEQKEADASVKNLMKDLSRLQAVHKSAVRSESKATKKHAKAVQVEHKTNNKLITAQNKHEKAVADLKARTDALAAKKDHASTQYTLLNAKTMQLEDIRAKKAVEDRERGAKLQALATNPTGV